MSWLRKIAPTLSISLVLAVGMTAIATSLPSDHERLCALEAIHDIEYTECLPPTTTTLPPTTTTTLPPTTTTTLPPTTTTLPPTTTTTIPPFKPDQCVLDQIARQPFKPTGGPRVQFNIEITNLDIHTLLWAAPYKTDLGTGYGWINGDRPGYKGAYMFLVELATGRVVARVMFQQVPGAAYMQVNDRFGDEIQDTKIGWDGTCGQPPTQGQMPDVTTAYEANNGPEDRPVILFQKGGVTIEDRSYTNTVTPGTNVVRFHDLGHSTVPFISVNGFGTDPHTVYERQVVGAFTPINGQWLPGVVVYYDTLVPDVTISN